jgi:hypothetical protein
MLGAPSEAHNLERRPTVESDIGRLVPVVGAVYAAEYEA